MYKTFIIPTVGRVHEALISAVDPRSPFVSVEWTENGETKGKEVGIIWNESPRSKNRCSLIG